MRTKLGVCACVVGGILASCSSGDGHPDGGAVPDGWSPPTINCEAAAAGRAFEVGPGEDQESLDDVPWEDLIAGDTVRVHYRSEPYRSKIAIAAEGTAEQPVRVCGVAGPNGELPVIDGDGATTRPELADLFDATWTEHLAVVTVDYARVSGDWATDRPSYVVIEGLVIRGAASGGTWTDAAGGSRVWGQDSTGEDSATAGIWVQRGEHIVIRGCELTDNDISLFVMSKDESTPAAITRDVLVEGNYVHGNGVVGSDRRHNIYTEAAGVTFQYNYIGEEREGALGSALKDRSAGTVIRFNWIESGARTLDLVDPEDAPDSLPLEPGFHETFVYGNVFLNLNARAGRMFHYGGDTTVYEIYRKGTLYFYANTVLINASADERWNTTLFDVSTDDETVEARNNVIVKAGTTNLLVLAEAGHVVLGPSWMSAGWSPGDAEMTGTVTGDEHVISGDNPQLDTTTLRPLAGSPLIDEAGALAEGAAGHPVDREYVQHGGNAARQQRGAAADLGAYESE